MSIQRYSVIGNVWDYEDNDGKYVLYADHVAAVQESQAWHYKRGAEDERARIRQAVLDYYKVAPKAAAPLLRIIDGDEP